MTPELVRLIEEARLHQWTAAERREFLISFAHGNIVLDDSLATREDVEKAAYDELHKEAPKP